MKKHKLFKIWLLAVILFAGSGVAWGATETLTCTAGTIVNNTMTFSTANFTIVHSKGSDANFASYTPWRVYTNNTVSITGGSNVSTITSIVINATSEVYATAITATGSNISVTGGGSAIGSVSGTKCTLTISGTASAVSIKPSAQTRWSSIEIYYTIASSCTSLGTPTVTATPGNTEATLSWAAVANASSYTLVWNGGSAETVTSPVTKTGLTNGTSYSYSVMAIGDGTTYCAANTAATGNVTPTLSAPTATAATSVSASGFTANWNASAGATGGYKLDVSSIAFSFVSTTETFTAIGGGTSSSYLTRSWTGVGGITWTSYNTRTDQVITAGNDAITLRDASDSYLVSGEITGSPSNITFDIKQVFSGSGGNVILKILSGTVFSTVTTIGTYSYSTTAGIINANVTGIVGPFKVQIENGNTNARPCIDNLAVTWDSFTPVGVFDNYSVAGTSQAVGSLSSNTTYYYRVRATDGTNVSENSNTITAFSAIDGTVNASAMPDCPTCDVVVANGGTLTVDATKTYNSVVIAPLGHLTLNDTKTLSVSGNLTIQSDANGTGTLVDANAAGGLTVTGTTNVEQWLTVARQWWYLSSPLSVAKTTTFTPSNKIGTYNEATSTYSNPLATDVSLEVGRGYVVKLSDAADKAYTFTGGNLNTGDKTLTLTRTGNTAPKRGFNLVGNPYPSYIDWDLVFDPATATNMRNAIWFRTYDTTKSMMDFHTYSDGDGVPETTSPLIAPMQAFWVKVDADPATNETVSNGSLTFKNTHRKHFETGANPLKVKALDARPRLRLVVSNGTATDEMLVVGKSYASDVLDSYDIEKFSNDNNAIPEVYSEVSNQELVINSMNALTEGKTVTLGFRPGQTGTNFTIEATQLDNIDAKVMLLDKEEGTEQELTAGTSYSFEVTDATPTTDRFVISLVSKVPTGIETGAASGDMTVYTNRNNRIQLIYRGELNDQTAVSVYNVAGQKLSTQKVVKAATELSGTFNPGVYMIQLTDNGKKITQKLIIK